MAVRWQRRCGAAAAPALVAALLAAALTPLTAGCAALGGTADGRSPGGPGASRDARPAPDAVRRAAEALVRAGTSRVRTSMEMASGGTRVVVQGAGSFDYARGTGRLVVSLPRGTSGERPGERRPVVELLTPRALYMKNREGVPPGKWVRVPTATLPDGNLVSGGATDPVSAAELLRGARTVRRLGATDLDGTRVWHFRGTVDVRAAADAASPSVRRRLTAAEKGFSGHTIPFDAYLDGQGRLRKVRHRFTFAGERGDVTVLSTTRAHGFGVPVRVTMPEDRDIYAGAIAVP
ncbi:hypothetical protein [Streptomyces boncukensis]|uniref:Lipoprotein n=1 Tax=Streptomyces boncukensis TaxID=2711219 RepID=A0A6G4X633_9ACTN|nr:hypothetical protein [Streptomyces boncukensis]NGO72592.1 hypothetical protein [Streptomyces boncukensis]